ncbi:MAG TPA: HAMP domain-containing sensor histidine kinase [Polyangia bacterium]|nr:HAMP domain-containing sensor histidine kinase [Polyangia bacterium]
MPSARHATQRSAWRRYGAAVLLTCLVVAGRVALDPIWGHRHNRHLVFIPTVLVAAWLGGLGPGVVSAVLSTLALGYFWMDVTRESVPVGVVELGLFCAIGVALSAMVESLHRARARAEAAVRSRERVMEIVAHDLRNPLGAIGMSAEALLLKATRDEDRRDVERILRATSRMNRLIGDLVDVSGIEHETLAMTRTREPVESIIRETAEAFAPRAEQRHITLEVQSPPADLAIAADRARIVQLLGNLVGNALKFTPEGGRVAVRVSEQNQLVRFEVADTGPGIPPDDVPHIFEQYWKGDGEGTGLGLFIARSIVEAHRGELGVKTAPGAGATFFFTLPRE